MFKRHREVPPYSVVVHASQPSLARQEFIRQAATKRSFRMRDSFRVNLSTHDYVPTGDTEIAIRTELEHSGTSWRDSLHLLNLRNQVTATASLVLFRLEENAFRYEQGWVRRSHFNLKDIRQRVEAAELESLHTCEICGLSGKLREDGWIKTYATSTRAQGEQKSMAELSHETLRPAVAHRTL